jgi:hypothetical protein
MNERDLLIQRHRGQQLLHMRSASACISGWCARRALEGWWYQQRYQRNC